LRSPGALCAGAAPSHHVDGRREHRVPCGKLVGTMRRSLVIIGRRAGSS